MAERPDLEQIQSWICDWPDELCHCGWPCHRVKTLADYALALEAQLAEREKIANAAHRYITLHGTGTVGEGGALVLLQDALARLEDGA